jgi:hypothetical protein
MTEMSKGSPVPQALPEPARLSESAFRIDLVEEVTRALLRKKKAEAEPPCAGSPAQEGRE